MQVKYFKPHSKNMSFWFMLPVSVVSAHTMIYYALTTHLMLWLTRILYHRLKTRNLEPPHSLFNFRNKLDINIFARSLSNLTSNRGDLFFPVESWKFWLPLNAPSWVFTNLNLVKSTPFGQQFFMLASKNKQSRGLEQPWSPGSSNLTDGLICYFLMEYKHSGWLLHKAVKCFDNSGMFNTWHRTRLHLKQASVPYVCGRTADKGNLSIWVKEQPV